MSCPRPRKRPGTDAERLLHMVAWEGPLERLAALCFGIRRDLTIRRVVRDGSFRDLLGVFLDELDHDWHDWHMRRGSTPWRGWKRRAR